MNLVTIEKIPYKEKKLIVQEACLMYRKLRLIDSDRLMTLATLADQVRSKNLENIKSLSIFETIFSLLNDDDRWIIENEFVNNISSQYWADRYSKTTYYKFKHRAIDNFIFLLYA